MKKILLTLIFALTFIVSEATEKTIIAEVVFENLTGKEFTSGIFFVTETNERIEIYNAQSFKITLPGKGKYQFHFATEDFMAYTYYPSKITDKKNIITIRLVEKKKIAGENRNISIPINLESALTDEQLEQRITEGNINFILHGIDNSIPKEFAEFQKKYGIGVIKENCVVDPLSYKKATENNQIISEYLNRKFGKDWLLELPTKPFGIQ